MGVILVPALSIVSVKSTWTPGVLGRRLLYWHKATRIGFPPDPFVDGNMEAAGVGAWTPLGGAILTKSAASPHTGTRALRVAGVPGLLAARESVLVAGSTYTIAGFARGDGVSRPELWNAAMQLWAGTSSVAWQAYSFLYAAVGTVLDHYIVGAGGAWVEWDDITVTPRNANSARDLSGNSRHLAQPTAARCPLSGVVTTPSGKPALQFDGVFDFLKTANDPTIIRPIHRFTAFRPIARLQQQDFIDGARIIQESAIIVDMAAVGYNPSLYSGAFLPYNGPPPDNTWGVYDDILALPPNALCGFNGGALAAGAIGAGEPEGLTVGASSTGGAPATMHWHEDFAVSGALSASERALAVAYLRGECGI